MNSDNQWAEICAMWSTDEEFRERMVKDPKTALGEFGVTVDDGVTVFIHAPRSPSELHLVMPPLIEAGQPGVSAVNDGRTRIECSSSPPGSTCWDTPNCPTRATCQCYNTAC